MKESYINLCKKIGRVANTRDVHRNSIDNNGYGIVTYQEHFGSLYNLQIMLGITPPQKALTKNKTKLDLLNDLKELSIKINRTPTVYDIEGSEICASRATYYLQFGGFKNALILAGLENESSIFKTTNGVRVKSFLEMTFGNMLEKYNFEYKTEIPYMSVINNFKRKYRFDFQVTYNNHDYYIEIFGIKNNKSYKKRIAEKIKICENNHINLITIYPNDIPHNIDELYDLFIKKINKNKLAEEYDKFI